MPIQNARSQNFVIFDFALSVTACSPPSPPDTQLRLGPNQASQASRGGVTSSAFLPDTRPNNVMTIRYISNRQERMNRASEREKKKQRIEKEKNERNSGKEGTSDSVAYVHAADGKDKTPSLLIPAEQAHVSQPPGSDEMSCGENEAQEQ